MTSNIDAALWWSGLMSWIALGFLGAMLIFDQVLEFTLASLRLKKEFIAWSWERIRARHKKIPGG